MLGLVDVPVNDFFELSLAKSAYCHGLKLYKKYNNTVLDLNFSVLRVFIRSNVWHYLPRES